MAFFDKIGDIAKTVGEKTGDAIETSKIQLKIRNEKSEIEKNYKLIGEYFYKKYLEDNIADENVSKYYDAITLANENIKKHEENIEKIKTTTGSIDN
ncbi:MAG: hypothetical protein K6G26_01285 [Lachnospiraceae bacterium]|nr:hypothetical protein [Lachnospiraceae bacterium]